MLLDYFAKTAGQARVTVADSSGKRVRQFTTRADAGVVNRVAWDLRYDAPVAVENAGGRGGRGGAGGGGRGGRGGAAAPAQQAEAPAGEEQFGGELQNEFGVAPIEGIPPAGGGGGGGGRGGLPPGRGQLAEPGTYKVTIELAGKTDSKTVTVEQDPRIQVPASDRETRRRTIDTLVTLTRDADAARRRAVGIRNSLTSLTDSWKQPNAPPVPDAVKKSADELLERAKTVANRFEAPGGGRGGAGGGAGSPPPYTPPPVTQKSARLLGALDSYTGAPTARQLAEAQDCSAQLQKDVAELNKLGAEIPRLNKMLSDAGVAYVSTPN